MSTDSEIEKAFKKYSYEEYPFTEKEWEAFRECSIGYERFKAGFKAGVGSVEKKKFDLYRKSVTEEFFLFDTGTTLPEVMRADYGLIYESTLTIKDKERDA